MLWGMARRIAERWLYAKRIADENEGVWIKVSTTAFSSWARHVITGRLRAFASGGYDAMIREGNGTTGTLFIRKIPQEELHGR